MQQFRELIAQSQLEAIQPQVVATRCVHSLLADASCQACVRACPEQAWIFDEDGLSLDAMACDGCGICIPACPQGALLHDYEASLIVSNKLDNNTETRPESNYQEKYQGQKILLFACEYSGSKTAQSLPCINAFGLHDLLYFYLKEIKQILLVVGECESCPRHRSHNLEKSIQQLNLIFGHSKIPSISYALVSGKDYDLKGIACLSDEQNNTKKIENASYPSFNQDGRDNTNQKFAQEHNKLYRRRFFHQLIASTSVAKSHQIKHFEKSKLKAVPAASLFPAKARLLPYRPKIKASNCIACHACSNLCPHQAISLKKDENHQSCYLINPRKCSGCQLCVDVCEHDAIELKNWKINKKKKLKLLAKRCQACGVEFYFPKENKPLSGAYCQICRSKNHYKNLYQVLA